MRFRWVEGSPPELPVTQVYGFCFDDRGRILLVEDQGIFGLPGGKPEVREKWEETLRREVYEEAQVSLGSVRLLGYQVVEDDPDFMGGSPHAQLRYIARMDRELPPAPDPATGRQPHRSLHAPSEVADLLGWGEEQVESARALASRIWRPVPHAAGRSLTDG